MAFLMRHISGRKHCVSSTGHTQRASAVSGLKCLFSILISILFLTGTVFPAQAETPADSTLEYRVKAAFLLNFCRFVSWPETAFKTADDPIVLCILGEDPFGEALDALSGKKAQGHPLEIRYTSNSEEAASCHLLFVSQSMEKNLDLILSTVQNNPTLTVSDMNRFVQRGGMVGLILSGTSIRFMINPTSAASSGLKISSQLLKLAIILGQQSPDGE